ncbi:hypothetical protein [Mesorhizobium abyssinicae]|uniref:hypothetical protein n=1 Tax=Mesorhizobium abyssinicae TaxID=1209958 RepID=UPI003397B39F
MKTKLLASVLAGVLVSACSGSSNPFDGKPPEEVAMFIFSGFQKGTVRKDKDFELKVLASQDKPLVLTINGSAQGQSRDMATFSVTDQGNCSFLYSVVDKGDQNTFGTWQARIDLSGLTDAKLVYGGPTDSIALSGSKIQCLASGRRECEWMGKNFAKGTMVRFGPIDLDEKQDGYRELKEKILGEAVQYLKTKICKI